MSFTAAEAQRAITELYVGIFNRAPDPEGLAYWTDKLVVDGADIDEVRAAFVSSPEWQNGVGQSTNSQVVIHLYESLFERLPDAEGLEFWVTALEEGRVTVDEIVKNLLEAASAYDRLTVDNKVDAALYYTTQSGGPDMVNDAGFNGADATAAVDGVDSTAESLEASKAGTDASLATQVFLQLSGDASATEADGAALEHTITVVDENGNPVVLAEGQAIAVNLSYTMADASGADFSQLTTYVTLTGDGESSSFTFANVVADDSANEGTESYTVSIASVAGNTTSFDEVVISGAMNSAQGSIVDDADVRYTLEVFGVVNGEYVDANSMSETGGTAKYVVVAVDADGNALAQQPSGTVDVSVTGATASIDDHDSAAIRTVTLGTSFTISAVADDLVEGDETFAVALVDGSFSQDAAFEEIVYQGEVVTTIVDPAPLIVQLSGDASVTEADGAELEHTISLVDIEGNAVVLAEGESVTLTLSYAASGIDDADLSQRTTQVVLSGDGESSTFTFANVVADDLANEGTESYTVSIASVASNATSFDEVVISDAMNSAQGSIVDDADVRYTLEVFAIVDGEYVSASSMPEAGGEATYVVLAVDAAGNPMAQQPSGTVDVSVAGDTASIDDFDSAAIRTVSLGAAFDVTGVADTLVEGDETYVVALVDGSFSQDAAFEEIIYQGEVVTTIVDSAPIYELTTAEGETITASAGDDLIRGAIGRPEQDDYQTLNAYDTVLGGDGNDTLELALEGQGVGIAAFVDVKEVETLTIDISGVSTMDMELVGGDNFDESLAVVNVTSTGGVAEDVTLIADVSEINIGMTRSATGDLATRGVIEGTVDLDVVDAEDGGTYDVAVAADGDIHVASTGDLRDVDIVGGSNAYILVTDDVDAVNAITQQDLTVEAFSGDINMVDARSRQGDITVDALPDDVTDLSSVNSVSARADQGDVTVEASGNINSVDAEANGWVRVHSTQGDIDTVTVSNFTLDGQEQSAFNVLVDADAGSVDDVDAEASGYISVTAGTDVNEVTADAGTTVSVYAGNDVNTVVADAGTNVWVEAEDGTVDDVDAVAGVDVYVTADDDVNSVTATAGNNVDVTARNGMVDMATAFAGNDVDVSAGTDINDVNATAGGNVNVEAGGAVDAVDATADGNINVVAATDVNTVMANAGGSVAVDAEAGTVDSVDATADGNVTVVAGDDVNEVMATAGGSVTVDAQGGTVDEVNATADGSVDIDAMANVNTVNADAGVDVTVNGVNIDDVDVTAGGDVAVIASGDINEVTGTAGDFFYVFAGGAIENVEASGGAGYGGTVRVLSDEGDIGNVDADAYYVAVESNQGDINNVTADAGTDVFVEARDGSVGNVDATAGDDVYVYAAGDISSVNAVADDYVEVYSWQGDISSVTATGSNVYVSATDGAVGTVNATADDFAGVYASDDITSVQASAYNVYVNTIHGDVGSVEADAEWDVGVYATDGSVGTVTATAGDDVRVYAADDVGSVDATADDDIVVQSNTGNIGSVEADSGDDVSVYASDDVGSVDATAEDRIEITSYYGNIGSVMADAGGAVVVQALQGDISTVNLQSSDSSFVYAEGSIGAVTAVTYEDLDVIAYDGIGSVEATAIGDDFADVFVDAFGGDIGSVVADASDDVYVRAWDGSIGSVSANALDTIVVSASDDIDSVLAVADGTDSSVTVTSNFGNIGSVDATAASGDVVVDASNGSVGSVEGSAGSDYEVYGSDGVGMVDVSAGDDVFVGSSNGNIGSVAADAADLVSITATNGTIGTVEATAGGTAIVYASDDIGSVDATAGYYVSVESGNGSIGDVDLTTTLGGDINVAAAGNIDTANLDSSDAVFVYAGGAIGDVTSVAGGYTQIIASDDINSVTATTTGGDDADISVTSFGGGDIASVVADASDDLLVQSYDGSIGSVIASAESALVYASDTVGTVDITLTAGDDYSYLGEDALDAAVVGGESVGSVTVGLDTSDESLELVVASLGDVGDVTVNLGQTSTADIDIHAQNDDAVTVALTGNVDNDSSVGLFVGSAMSDPDGTGPTTLNLSSNGVTSDGQGMGIDVNLYDELGTGDDEISLLETINFTGDSNVSMGLLGLQETLTTYDGATGSGDQSVWMGINDVSDQTVLVNTGSGNDSVNLWYQASDDNGDVTVNLADGNDVFTNGWSGDATGSLTIDSGSGSDQLYVYAGADADINVTAGADDDYVEIVSAVDGVFRVASGGDAAAAPGGYVDVSIDVNAGSGDDEVVIYANRDSIEAGSFAMGDGTNELYFNYHPYSQPSWSDSDIARFTAEMGDNVTGGVHTLGLNVDLDISDDVTLALPGDGGVSVLEIGEIELVTDDTAQGSTLNITGAAEDFTLTMAYDSGDDLGNATSTDSTMDEDALRLALDGVVDVTLDADEVGVIFDSADNTALETITVTSGNDHIDVAVVGFENGMDISLASGLTSEGNSVQLFAFGGQYGDISIVSSDDETNMLVEAAGINAGVDVGDYTFTANNITISSLTAGDDDGYADDTAEFEVDGYSASGPDDARYGVANVFVGSLSMTGAQGTDIDIDDLSDGSTVTIGSIDMNIQASDDEYGYGGIEVDGFTGTSIDIGTIDVDVNVGGEDSYNTIEIAFYDGTDSSVSVGSISVDRVQDSDDVASFGNNVDVIVDGVGRSTVDIGSIDVDLAGAGFGLTLNSNDNTSVTIGDIHSSGEDGSVVISNSVATSDGTDVMVTLGDITMHDNQNDSGLFGEDGGLQVVIAGNTDDFTAGMVEISTGDITLSGSDSAAVIVSGNSGEFELFDTPLVPLVGVQIEMGDIDVDLNSSSDNGCDDVMATSLSVTNNIAANISVGEVDVSMGSDAGYIGYWTDGVTGNDEVVYTRGDTTVSIGNDDGGIGLAATAISGNSDSELTFGDYSVSVGTSDSGVGYGYIDMAIGSNNQSNIDIGDVSLVIDGNSDGGNAQLVVTDNATVDITLGNVVIDGASDSSLLLLDNTDSTVEIGTVELGGDGLVGIADNTNVTIEMGNVTVVGEGSDATEYDGDFGGIGVFTPGLVVTDNVSSTVTIGDFTSTATYTDAVVMIHDNTDSTVDVGNITLTNVDDVTFDVHGNTDATVTVGAVMVSDATGDLFFNIEENVGTDASVEVGDVTVYGSTSADVQVDYNDHSTVTVGNILISDAYGSFNLDVTNNEGSDTSVTLGNVTVDETTRAYVQIDSNTDGAEITLGNIDLSGTDAAFFGFEVSNNTDASVTVGTVTASGMTDADFLIRENWSGTVTVGDLTLTEAERGFDYDVLDHSDATIDVGNTRYIGAVSSDADGGDVDVDVRDNDYSTVTLGDFYISDVSQAYFEVDDHDNSTVTIGAITVSDSTGDIDFEMDNNDYSTLDVGDITGINGDDVDFRVEDNYGSTITFGNLYFSDVDTFDFEISSNAADALGEDTSSITIGNVTVSDLTSVDVKITDHDYASITVGDMLFSDATGNVDFHFTDNDYSTVEVGDFTVNGTSGDFEFSVTDSDYSTITVGSISVTQTSGDGADFLIEDNSYSTIGSDSSSVSISTNSGGIYFEIDENNDSTIMFSDVTLSNTTGSVDVDIMDNEIDLNNDTSVSIGDLTISAGTNVDIDIDGDEGPTANSAAVGDIDVTVTGTGTANDVDIELNSVDGAESITVSGNVATLDIRLGDQTDTVTATTEIDLSGMTNENAEILIDFVDNSGTAPSDDYFGIGDTGLNPAATGDANLSDDITITFGEFASAYVETFINDHYDQSNIQDLDGVRQTYVFEGSDIGDIIIEGFVAGFGAYRDVDIDTTEGGSFTGGRYLVGDGGGEAGQDWHYYGTASGDNLVQLRTDRLDFSQFEGVDSLDDLSFEYDDDSDSVIITAADGQFDGRIVVTGTGVDSDNGDSIESIIDRVADSIIFG